MQANERRAPKGFELVASRPPQRRKVGRHALDDDDDDDDDDGDDDDEDDDESGRRYDADASFIPSAGSKPLVYSSARHTPSLAAAAAVASAAAAATTSKPGRIAWPLARPPPARVSTASSCRRSQTALVGLNEVFSGDARSKAIVPCALAIVEIKRAAVFTSNQLEKSLTLYLQKKDELKPLRRRAARLVRRRRQPIAII